jgi:hypothetical protein
MHQAAEFFDRSLLAFGYELLVDVERPMNSKSTTASPSQEAA